MSQKEPDIFILGSHVVPLVTRLSSGKTVRLWELAEHLGDEGDPPAQRIMEWLSEHGYRYVRIYGESCKPYSGWVHRNQPCPECGARFDIDGRCTMGCINH